MIRDRLNKLDSLILTFKRQYRIADPDSFESEDDIPKVKRVLMNFLDSNIFKSVMNKYKVWSEDSDTIYFPYF